MGAERIPRSEYKVRKDPANNTWTTIPGFDGAYEIDYYGNIRRNTPIYTGDGGESVNEDPLSAARGIINGLIFSIPIWAIIVGLYQLW